MGVCCSGGGVGVCCSGGGVGVCCIGVVWVYDVVVWCGCML